MSTNAANPYDAPAEVVEEIFGASTEAGRVTGEPRTFVALLDDVGGDLKLTIQHPEGPPSPEGPFAHTQHVVDTAEADRAIAAVLQAHPDYMVMRTGDGWATHSE